MHSKEVPYEKLLNKMFQMNAGYFLIQCASEDDKETVYKLVGENLRDDAEGVTQMAFIGVINPLSPEVETPEEVRDRLVKAAEAHPASSSWGPPTTAASRRFRATSSPATAATPTTPATWPCRRSRTGSRARRWRARSWASKRPRRLPRNGPATSYTSPLPPLARWDEKYRRSPERVEGDARELRAGVIAAGDREEP